MRHFFDKIPPWWLVTRAELATVLDTSLDTLAQKHMRQLGPQPLPHEWQARPKSKRVYRKANIISDDPTQVVTDWLARRSIPGNAQDIEVRMDYADRVIRHEPSFINLARSDIRDRPRLRKEFKHRLDNPNDLNTAPWDHPVLEELNHDLIEA